LIKPPGSGDREPLRLSGELRELSAGLESNKPFKEQDTREERARWSGMDSDVRQRESGREIKIRGERYREPNRRRVSGKPARRHGD
jgi:hypothetical protein